MTMSNYIGLSSSIFDEPEYRDTVDCTVAFYLMLNRDMAGVVGIHDRSVSAKCRVSKGKLWKTLEYFQSVDKLVISVERNHIWWRSGIYHSLFKGQFSEKQMKSVVKTLTKWQISGVFGENFVKSAVQLYDTKYSLTIPITMKLNLTKTKKETKLTLVTSKSDHSEAIKYFSDKYFEYYDVKYDFKAGKDGAIIKQLLGTWKLDGLKMLIDALFASNDKWYDTTGRTIGILSTNSNKLATENKGGGNDRDEVISGEVTI